MATPDSLSSCVDGPWKGSSNNSKSVVTPLPGLAAQAIEGLKPSFPGNLHPRLRELLMRACGLGNTALGNVDFTGQWHDEEPIAVFRPSLTLAIDEEGRRWIAEGAFDNRLPGPVWCIFPDPQVALHVSDDLAEFLAELQRKSCAGEVDEWLDDLSTSARAVWKHRTDLGVRPGGVSDPSIRAWASSLPADALVYDLRSPSITRGWPYGVAGPSGRLYRCGRAPVFAVSGPPASDRWARRLSEIAETFPVAQPAIAQRTAMPRALPYRKAPAPVEQPELRRCA